MVVKVEGVNKRMRLSCFNKFLVSTSLLSLVLNIDVGTSYRFFFIDNILVSQQLLSLHDIVADCFALETQIAQNITILVIERTEPIFYLFSAQATIQFPLFCFTVHQYCTLVRQRDGCVPQT